ncbi:MAG: LLM class flavin-dependent oxidoreductase [Acidimicrobiales bacterium]|nr:LLM class flavin-dependent oxidoreductase [Acidimicrobiales bacterium]
MTTVSFGLFDWCDHRPGVPLHQLYDERIQMAALAEEVGFTCYQVAEHHSTPLGAAPSPNLLLAAMARATTSLRIGPLCWLLPLYEPLRLYEELCMLDHLSHGRLEIGIGRGVSRHEVGFFNRDPKTTRALFDESLEVLLSALQGERRVLSAPGPSYRYDDVPLVLSPYQKPYPPLWYPTTSKESAIWAGRRNLHLMGLGPARAYRPVVDAYRAAREAPPEGARRLNPHVTEPIIGMNRQIIVADTDEDAYAVLAEAFPIWKDNFSKLAVDRRDDSEASREELRHYRQRTDLQGMLDSGALIVGSPDTVREGIAAMVEDAQLNYVACTLAWGGITGEQARRSLLLFGTEVAPAFTGAPQATA